MWWRCNQSTWYILIPGMLEYMACCNSLDAAPAWYVRPLVMCTPVFIYAAADSLSVVYFPASREQGISLLLFWYTSCAILWACLTLLSAWRRETHESQLVLLYCTSTEQVICSCSKYISCCTSYVLNPDEPGQLRYSVPSALGVGKHLSLVAFGSFIMLRYSCDGYQACLCLPYLRAASLGVN